MDIQEFPKMLYKGDVNAIVHSEAEEAGARQDGWHDFGATPAATPAPEPEAQAPAGQEQASPKAQARSKKAQADQAPAGQE